MTNTYPVRLITRISLLTLCWVVWPSSGAIAQDVGASAVLEEIVVTAQKREQSLQEVPISISVVDGTKILEQGFNRLAELSDFIPNFNVNEGLPGSTISIRGFNTSASNSAAFEQAVAIFVDDVYFGRIEQSFTELLDLERVEVLRGPQTTFFGQSAIAGALNIVTRKPGLEEWEGYIDAAYGSDADARLQLAYGGPVTDTFGIRFAGSSRDFDGWVTNTNGEDGLGQESWTGRVTACGRQASGWTSRLNMKRVSWTESPAGTIFSHVIPPTPPTTATYCGHSYLT